MTSDPTTPLAMRRTAEAAASAVRVAVSCEVVSYDHTDQTVSVRPMVADPGYRDGAVHWRDTPPLDGVPVAWLRAGSITLTAGVSAGDVGLLLIRDRSHDEIDAGQGARPVTTPASARRWDYADAVYLPAQVVPADPIGSAGVAASGDPVLGMGSGRALRVGASNANKAVAIAEDCAARIERIEAYLNTATYLTPTGGTTIAPAPPPFVGTTSTAPLCTASVVVGSVPATGTAAVASSRLYTDDT